MVMWMLICVIALAALTYPGLAQASCGGDENAESGCSLNCGSLCADLENVQPVCPEECPSNGCQCKFGFYFDPIVRKCVVPRECTPVSCEGDPNAEFGCSTCRQSCADVSQNDGALSDCPADCRPDGCVCKPGFSFDNNFNRCVRPFLCTMQCPENETYFPCINGLCMAQECKDKGQPIPCPGPTPGPCLEGCICKVGYLRKNGTCVPTEECDD